MVVNSDYLNTRLKNAPKRFQTLGGIASYTVAKINRYSAPYNYIHSFLVRELLRNSPGAPSGLLRAFKESLRHKCRTKKFNFGRSCSICVRRVYCFTFAAPYSAKGVIALTDLIRSQGAKEPPQDVYFQMVARASRKTDVIATIYHLEDGHVEFL